MSTNRMTDIYEETTLKFFSVLSSASGLDPTNKKRNIDGLNVKKYLLKETQVALSKALLLNITVLFVQNA